MRPHQWIKNVIVYAALVFDGKLLYPDLFLKTTWVAFCFCLAASSVYLMNDLVDIEKDRQHPRKRLRPLPSGQLSPAWPLWLPSLLAIISLVGTTSGQSAGRAGHTGLPGAERRLQLLSQERGHHRCDGAGASVFCYAWWPAP